MGRRGCVVPDVRGRCHHSPAALSPSASRRFRWALTFGGIGLLAAGGVAASFTRKSLWFGSIRQLAFGAGAIGVTYVVGMLIGTALG